MQPERHVDDTTPKWRQQVEAPIELVLEPGEVVTAGHGAHVEHGVLQGVHVQRGRLVVQEARIEARQSLHAAPPLRQWKYPTSMIRDEAVDALVQRAHREVDDGLLPSCQLAVAHEGEIVEAVTQALHESSGAAPEHIHVIVQGLAPKYWGTAGKVHGT